MTSLGKPALSLAALLVVWGTGIAPAQASDDTWITTKIKAVDKDVKDAVEKALKADESLEGIKVKSVENGLVFLDGHTTNLASELRAIETAYGIAGVRQVDSGIETKEK